MFIEWDATEPSNGVFTFTGADQLVDFATQNGKMIRGHNIGLSQPSIVVGNLLTSSTTPYSLALSASFMGVKYQRQGHPH